MHTEADYPQVLKVVSTWPAEQRLTLVQEVLETVKNQERQSRPARDTLSGAVGLLRGAGPPPDDQAVKRWIDEHRTRTYGS
jgi:hypothetical protein